MQLTINVPDQLAERARALGVRTEEYVEQLLTRQVKNPPQCDSEAVKNAVEDIRRLRQGVRLDGLKIKDLIEEGRKH